jgi:hypothetical protein
VESLIALLQVALVVLLSVAPFVILVAGVLRLRGRRARVDRTAGAFSRASAAGVFPPSLRPPMDIEIAHEDTPVSDEMSPEALRKLRDTGPIVLPTGSSPSPDPVYGDPIR